MLSLSSVCRNYNTRCLIALFYGNSSADRGLLNTRDSNSTNSQYTEQVLESTVELKKLTSSGKMKVTVHRFDSGSIILEPLFIEEVATSMTIAELREILMALLEVSTDDFSIHIKNTQALEDQQPLSAFHAGPRVTLKIVQNSEFLNDKAFVVLGLVERRALADIQAMLKDWNAAQLHYILNKPLEKNWTLVHHICAQGLHDVIKIYSELVMDLNQVTEDGWTPLTLACLEGHTSLVRTLIALPSVNLDLLPPEHGTALHVACQHGRTSIVRCLLEADANFTLEDAGHRIPLEYCWDPDTARLLAQHTGQRELQKRNLPILPASYSGELLLSEGWFSADKSVSAEINQGTGTFEVLVDGVLLRVDLCQITSVRAESPARFRALSHYYFTVCGGGYKWWFYTIAKTYRDDWIRALLQNIHYFKAKLRDLDSLSDLEVGQLQLLNEIGRGAFGVVHRGLLRETQQEVAVKAIDKRTMRRKNAEKYMIQECIVMKQLDHPFVVKLHGIAQDELELFLVIDYCSHGDLDAMVGTIDYETARLYLAEILLALEYLHSKDILYRDLKPANILVDAEGHVKLTDFGLSKIMRCAQGQKGTFLGSPAYLSPELLDNHAVGKPADLYAFGITMHELLTGHCPYSGETLPSLFTAIKKAKYVPLQSLPSPACDLLKHLLAKKPSRRPSIIEIKQHGFFSGIDWESVLARELSPKRVNSM